MLLYRIPKMRNLAIPLLFVYVTLLVTAGPAHAADIDPIGIGDLIPTPDSNIPDDQKTLYETYSNTNYWRLDVDYGKWDILDPMAETIADICMALTAVIGQACVSVVQWIFQLTDIPALSGAVAKSIGGASKGLTVTLLPSALVVGGLVAFVKNREGGGGGGGMSQIAWVFISGVVSVSLLNSPNVWVDGIDSTRRVGAEITLNATSAGIGEGNTQYPFKMSHEPKFSGSGKNDMLRKSSDAIWRSYVAAPWCVANFGSYEVCQKYGNDLLRIGKANKDKRKEWLQNHVTDKAVGDDSVTWRQGHNPLGRVMVTLPAFVSILIFAAIVLMLAFTSLASLLGALMLLVAGVIFACLWVIPGRPRQWGLAWFDQLLARTLESMIATLVLGCVLIIQTATTTLFKQYGWIGTTGLSIAAVIIGLKFRSIIAQIVGVSGTSGGMLAGALLTRALNGGGRGGKRGGGDSGHNYKPVRTRQRPSPSSGAGGGRGGTGVDWSVEVFRPTVRPPAPKPLPGAGGAGGAGRPALPGGGGPTPPPAGPTPRPTPGGPSPLAPAGPAHAPAAVPAPPARRPALVGATAGTGAGHAGQGQPALPSSPSLPPGPTLRPEAGGAPHLAFRQAAPPAGPGAAQPRVIQGTVIRSTPVPPPAPRKATTTPPPKQAAAPARRAVPAPRPRSKE